MLNNRFFYVALWFGAFFLFPWAAASFMAIVWFIGAYWHWVFRVMDYITTH